MSVDGTNFQDLPRSMKLYLLGNFAVIVIGLLLFSLSQEIAKAIGPAVVASGIVGFVYFFYMRAEKRYEYAIRLTDEWGLLDIFSNRSDEELYRRYLVECEDVLDVQAISLTRLYTDLGDVIERVGKSGVEIRLLLLDPESEVCDWIESAHREYSDLETKIEDSTKDYMELDTENINIRYYDGLPVNYFRIDDRTFCGPYFTEPSRSTITFFADADKDLVEGYKNNFESVWEEYSSEPDL